MDLKEIESLITLAKKEGLSSLKYESEKVKISLTLPSYHAPVMPSHYIPMNTVNTSASAETSGVHKAADAKASATHQFHKVSSPFVGTFFTSPGPGEKTYVKVGDKVQKGQILCIVEAMKIMNEIESDRDGEVVEVCVDNESLVEYGQVLFLIK